MEIREPTVADASQIARVHVDSWRTTYAGIVSQAYLDSLSYEKRSSEWREIISDPMKVWKGWFCLVADESDSGVVGFARAGPERSGKYGISGELGAIYLLKAHHRKGIGRQLMAKVALRLREDGHGSLLAWVLAANPFKAFYEALGGRQIAERPVTIGGVDLPEIAYAWDSVTVLEGPTES
jgi:GNAT superfamily N-acetyltransferase